MPAATLFPSGVRFLALFVIQVFVLQQIGWGWGGREYLYVFLYPLFVALLPLRLPDPLVIFAGFLLGLSIDFFYETLGLHAAALTFTGFARRLVLRIFEPRDGYPLKAAPVPADLGMGWFLRYYGVLLLAHCLFFALVQMFSPVFWRDILGKGVFTFGASFVVGVAVVGVLRPRG